MDSPSQSLGCKQGSRQRVSLRSTSTDSWWVFNLELSGFRRGPPSQEFRTSVYEHNMLVSRPSSSKCLNTNPMVSGDPTLLTVSGSQYNTAPFLKSSELDSLQLSSYSTTLGGLGLMTPWLSNETPLQSWLSSPQRSHSYPLDGTTMQISGPISPYSSEQSQSIQAEPTSADLTIKQRSYVRQASGPEHGSNLMFRSQ